LDESGANATQFDLTNKLAYVYAKKNANYPYAGVKLLDRSVSPAYYPMTYQLSNDPLADEDFSIADKYKVISSGVKAMGLGQGSPDGYDVMFSVGSGPYNIPRDKSIKVSYAFIGGDNLSDLEQSAVAAQAKYDTGLGGVTPALPEATAYTLKQNYPNEASQFTHIPFTLPEKTTTSLTISDIQGRVVQTVINNQILEKGSYDIYLDLDKYGKGIYLYSLKAGSFKKSMKMIVVK
jgi:serine protease